MSDLRVPDSVEPIEAFRCWQISDSELVSVTNGVKWTPGEQLVARCMSEMATSYRWTFERGGMSHAEAVEYARRSNGDGDHGYYSSFLLQRPSVPNPPTITPPDGYGLALEQITHDAPAENCMCGIYATALETQVPLTGAVYGKVKLWGKIIPGEKGYRAEFAYPAEFWVPPEMEPNDCLLAFDVPIIIKDDLPKAPSNRLSLRVGGTNLINYANYAASVDFGRASSRPNRVRRVMLGAIALNLASAALNLCVAFHVI